MAGELPVTAQDPPKIVEFGGFRLDPVRRSLTRADEMVPLAPRAVDVLCVLVARAGQTVEKDELFREVWGSTVVEENTLARNILLIRKALGEKPGSAQFISTVAGRGYRFVQAVTPPPNGYVAVPEPKPERNRILAGGLTLVSLLAVAGMIAARWPWTGASSFFGFGSIDYSTRDGSVLLFAVSPDGRTLVYASGLLARQSLHIKDLVTNQETEILQPSGLHFMGLTVHGPGLYFVARDAGEPSGSLRRIPLSGGPAQPLFGGLESPVSFSPDGRIAFVREDPGAGESRLIVSQPDGSQVSVLASAKLPAYLDYPEWSPDGKHIAATRIDRRDNHVLVFESATGRSRRLGGRWGYAMRPRWMPGGRELILIARSVDDPGQQVWAVSWPEGTPKRITRDLDEYVDLQVSNDGKTLLAVNKKLATSIWTAPAGDPGQARRIGFGANSHANLVWTREGTLMYESGSQLWGIAADGSRRSQLTWEDGSYHPSICRENGNLAHIHDTPRGLFVNVVSNSQKVLHRIPVRSASGPECAPDGRWIAFMDGSKPGYPLVRLDLDTSRETVLSSSETASAAISRDGAKIAQLSETPDELRVLPASGVAPLHTYSLPASIHSISGVVRWTPDGKGVAYVDRSGGGNVWIQPLHGGPPQQFTKLNNERVVSFDWSLDGKQFGMIRASVAQDVVTIHGQAGPR